MSSQITWWRVAYIGGKFVVKEAKHEGQYRTHEDAQRYADKLNKTHEKK